MRLTLLHVFPTLAVGGQQTRFATIANALGPAFRHLLVSLDGREEAIGLLKTGVEFLVLRVPPLTHNPFKDLRNNAVVSSKIEADILITYNWGAIDWAILNRCWFRRPHIHLEDGFGPDEVMRQKRRRVLTRRLFLQRSLVVVPSEKLVQIAQRAWRLCPRQIRYVPNGIDASRFDRLPRDGQSFFHRYPHECVIGTFSPLRREKNLGRLLQAFADICIRTSAVRLVICGDGPERSELLALASRLKIVERVVFTGHINRPEAVLGAFDLFAMSSDTEQMPYAVLEAMAAALPIVATDVGDIQKMVATENREFIVSRDDLLGLSAALIQLCDSDILRRQVGRANRLRVEQVFSIGSMTEPFRRVLLEAAQSRNV
jgi:glycosyltransferase involved in cell wall biosynthesis